ncbi:MAG: aminotransferase class III-fold pyridoxal phosphate-dependent enzyme [Desulfatibacillum sp.]|nr:aminotransferase class III-fold pyridoxal phosphate-dependent enzyme [Desulfatibacillum sp.]
MKTYTYTESQKLFQRATKVIPCGIYGHLSPAPLIPADAYPFYVSKALGSRFWDVDGNEFIDYMCAYGPMVMGYNYKPVDDAAARQYAQANCVTSPGPVMVELAEKLVDVVSIADWAFFAKNGNDVTTYASMVARKATGRKKMVLIKGGYHGVAPWAQTFGHHGILEEDGQNTIRIPWNDFEAFKKVVDQHPNDIAGFMATPYHHPTFVDNEMPAPGYWEKVETLCKAKGIVLIVDDIRCGFRLDMRGSHEYFGFKPDLVCFCKAIGNGYPISALVGTDALKNDAAKVFYTGSYWFSAAPMAAALATLNEMEAINGPKVMTEFGEKLKKGLVDVAANHGYDLKVTGHPAMPYLRITDDPTLMLHQNWCAECTKRGAFFSSHHNWFVSTAHTREDLDRTLEIADDAFLAIKNNNE